MWIWNVNKITVVYSINFAKAEIDKIEVPTAQVIDKISFGWDGSAKDKTDR